MNRQSRWKPPIGNAARGVVIHAGPKLDGPGGVAAMMRNLRDSQLADCRHLVFVESVTHGAALPVRLLESALFPLRFSAALLRWPGALVHVHMARRGSFWRKRMAIGLARMAGRNVIIHIHGLIDTWAAGSPTTLRKVGQVLEQASAVVALSPLWRDRILTVAPAAKCVVIGNGVRTPDFVSEGSHPPCVLFLSMLDRSKGIDELLAAIHGIQSAGVKATWILAGHGDVVRTRRRVAALPHPDLVEVPGWVGPDEKTRLLRSSDVFVLPSHDEGIPVALLEAMSYGLACVVTPVGGIPDLVKDGDDGLFVDCGDVASLEGGLRRVLQDAALRRRLGRRARTVVQESYSMEVIAGQWTRLYEDVSAGRPVGLPSPGGRILSDSHTIDAIKTAL
jgi:glycosyltransferase involved in cell wall biosynthesis